MRTCLNCAFRQSRSTFCVLFGACKTKVEDPTGDRCSAHQYSEEEIKPLLDEAVNLLDSFMVALSANYEKRTKRVVSKYDELFQVKAAEKAK